MVEVDGEVRVAVTGAVLVVFAAGRDFLQYVHAGRDAAEWRVVRLELGVLPANEELAAISEPISSSGELSDAVVLQDGDGFDEVAGLAWAAAQLP
jgi:hypothetical protein